MRSQTAEKWNVLVNNCCITYYCKLSSFKTIRIYDLTVPGGQKSRNDLTGSPISEPLTSCNQGVLAGLQSPHSPTEKDLLPSLCGAGRTQFLISCWPEVTLSSLPCVSFQHGSSLHQIVQAKVAIQRVRWEDRSCNLLKLDHLWDIPSPFPCPVG